ncbi:uncharacterized protein LOC110808391 isoform X3 [Carica papaya]|uniref:uncharacterized protein LOC110808391 isoform X3 n=1 Tax=Carica papaya TaxID=3649 RepID=UPI000B8CC87B|nr:uncharacterized protein LOC110808391 isoform X3 [Carica papaya]
MKIFNWVQRRLHQSVIKDGLAKNVKKTESIAIDNNTQALLEQVAFVDVLEGWKDGILTIGTFGFDPLKNTHKQKQHFFLGSDEEEELDEDYNEGENTHPAEDDDDEDADQFSISDDDNNEDEEEDNKSRKVEDEEVNPLILRTFDEGRSNMDDEERLRKGDELIMSVELGAIVHVTTEIEQAVQKRRTTLAELFMADSDDMEKKVEGGDEFEVTKKACIRTKNGLSFAKKLIPHVGDDSRPIKKIQQMMKRMLKRKIHPELEGKSHKSNDIQLLSADTVSLLQPPDGTA